MHCSPSKQAMASTTHILDLPPEILTYLLSFLPNTDLVRVSAVCRQFYAAIEVESVWQKKCQDEFKIVDIRHSCETGDQQQLTYCEVYKNLLHKYGKLLGLWRPGSSEYGGLIHVQFEGATIMGYGLYPTSETDVHVPLKRQAIFSIGFTADRDVIVQCQQQSTPHECTVKMKSLGELRFQCNKAQAYRRVMGPSSWSSAEIMYEIPLLYPNGRPHPLGWRFNEKGAWSTLKCDRIATPRPRPGAVLQPGLFKGTYGTHGVELIMLSYDKEGKEATFTKITGDPNVPAGKITIKADLTRPMVLTRQQQSHIDLLESVPPSDDSNPLQQQPFLMPVDCYERSTETPSSCIARFHSEGQIAMHGFKDSSFIPGHWIVFDENTFGHIWLELRSFSIFSRCMEDLSSVAFTNS